MKRQESNSEPWLWCAIGGRRLWVDCSSPYSMAARPKRGHFYIRRLADHPTFTEADVEAAAADAG